MEKKIVLFFFLFLLSSLSALCDPNIAHADLAFKADAHLVKKVSNYWNLLAKNELTRIQRVSTFEKRLQNDLAFFKSKLKGKNLTPKIVWAKAYRSKIDNEDYTIFATYFLGKKGNPVYSLNNCYILKKIEGQWSFANYLADCLE